MTLLLRAYFTIIRWLQSRRAPLGHVSPQHAAWSGIRADMMTHPADKGEHWR